MKKMLYRSLCILLLAIFLSAGIGFAQQGNSLDTWLNSILGGFGQFGYVGTNISIKSVSSTGVVFESPVIRDENQQDVLKYVIWYGPYPFGKLLDGSSGVSTADFKSKEFTFSSHTGSTFTMTLTPSDNLVSTQLYYVTVVPIAANGDSGEMSGPDACFRFQPSAGGVGNECTSIAAGTQHNSAGGANMSLANISNTCTNNQITLTWSSVPGAQQVRIYKVVNGQPGTLLATRNMSDLTYTYALPNPMPPEVVRFVPVDASGNPSGTQHDYTLRLCTSTSASVVPSTPTPPRPGVPSVPKVGPEQDIAYVVLATLFVYGVIRLRKYRKAK